MNPQRKKKDKMDQTTESERDDTGKGREGGGGEGKGPLWEITAQRM